MAWRFAFHFASEIAQGGPSLRAMLAVFVPIIRPQGKKDADSYEDNLKEQVGKRASSAVKTHAREYRSMELGARSGREMVRRDR